MILLDVKQGDEGWINARLGIPTASCFDKIVTASGGKSSQSNQYMGELLAEYITGEQQSDFMSDDMSRGNEMEPFAISLYENISGIKIRSTGIAYLDDRKDRGASPDGLFDNTGIEVKSPKLGNHIGYVLTGNIPKKYIPQVQGLIYIFNCDSWVFMSYHPDYKPLIVTVKRDEKFIKKLSDSLDEFCDKLSIEKEKIDSIKEF